MVDARRRLCLLLAALLELSGCARLKSRHGLDTVELVHQVSGRQEHVKILYGAEGVRYERPDGTYRLRYADRTVAVVDAKDSTCRESSLDEFLKRQKEREHQPDLPEIAAGGASSFKLERAPEVSSFAGVRGHLVRISGDRFQVELWLSDEIAVPGPRRPTFEFLQALGGPLALPALLFDSLSGFPVRSVVRAQGGMFEIRVMRALLSAEPTDAAAAAFAPPAGCRGD